MLHRLLSSIIRLAHAISTSTICCAGSSFAGLSWERFRARVDEFEMAVACREVRPSSRSHRCGPASTTSQDLKLHQCHSLQYDGVSLAVLRRAKDRFRYGLDMRGTDGVRQ